MLSGKRYSTGGDMISVVSRTNKPYEESAQRARVAPRDSKSDMRLIFSNFTYNFSTNKYQLIGKMILFFTKELHCNPQNKVDNLNQSIRQVINRHTISNHFPLFSIDECNDPVLMIKRVNFDPF